MDGAEHEVLAYMDFPSKRPPEALLNDDYCMDMIA
jgi:hypothetical protein